MKKLLLSTLAFLLVCGFSMAQTIKRSPMPNDGGGTSPNISQWEQFGSSNSKTMNTWALPSDGSTSGNSRIPRNTSMRYQREEYLITPAEMAASGYPSGNTIDAIGYSIATAGVGTQTGTLNIYLRNTTDVTYTIGSTWTTTGFTMVSTNPTWTVPFALGTYTIPFVGGTPFTYTGGGVYVAWEFANPSGALGGTTTLVAACNTSQTTMCYGNQSATAASTTQVLTSWRPGTQFINNSITDVLQVTNIYATEKCPIPYGVPTNLSARVANISAAAETFNVTMTITDPITSTVRYTDTQTVTALAASTATVVNFTPWTASIQETDNVTVTVPTGTGETFLTNNTKTIPMLTNSDLFGYCYNLTPSTGYGYTYTGTGGIFANKFHMNGTGSILSANLFIYNYAANAGNTIYAVAMNSAGVIVAQSANLVIAAGDLGTNKNFSFPIAPSVTNEDYYIGLAQPTGGTIQWYPMGCMTEAPYRAATYYSFAITGGTPTLQAVDYKFMIEAQVGAPPSVLNPAGFTAAAVSSDQINLGWGLNANSNNVLVAWNSANTFGSPVNGSTYAAGNTIPGGGTVLQFNSATSFNHSGLSANTPYYYKAWSYDGSVYSNGVLTSATTPCSESASPWTENFELAAFPPACWHTSIGGGTFTRSIAASGYGTGAASAFANFFSISGTTPFALFTLPFNRGTLTTPTLKFDYAYATYATEVDEMDVYYSVDGGSTFTLLLAMPGGLTGILNTAGATTSAFIPTAAQWATKSITLPAGTNMVKFNAISAFGNNLYLDNVLIEEAATCGTPTTVVASSIAQTTATISWSAPVPAPSEGYEYEIRTSGTGGSGSTGLFFAGTTVAGVVSADITGLVSATDYLVYVRSNCGAASFSTWASGSFTTLCDVLATPFTETFEASPACWTVSGGADNWSIVTGASGYGIGNGSAYADFYNTPAATTFALYTPTFNSSALTNPQLKFDFAYATYATEMDEMDVYYSTDGGTTFTLLLPMPGGPSGILNTAGSSTAQFVPTAAQWKTQLISLPAGTNKVEFRAISAYGNNLFLDNVTVREAEYPTTFNVDMSTAEGFDAATDVVYLTGAFPGANWVTPGDPGSMTMTQVGSTLTYTRTLSLLPAAYEYKYFKNAGWDGGEYAGGLNRSVTITAATTLNDTWGGKIDWANLQWPATGSMATGGSFNVFAQAYINNGITGSMGATYGLQAWIGYSTSNTDPSTWTNWVAAPFHIQSFDNDEYSADLGTAIATPGTYYYASRLQFGNGTMVYGGFNGGFWDGTTNVSGVLTVTTASKTLNLKAYLQGFWNGTGMNQTQDVDVDFNVWNKWTGTTVDTLSVYLAEENTPFGYVFQAHSVNIGTDGSMTIEVPAFLSGNYYIALMHRSSVETWSASPVSFSEGVITYNFTTAANQAFGSNQFDLNSDGSVWGLFGGEIYGAGGTLPADGWIDLNDLNPVYNRNVDGAFGYSLEDITGDGFVDLSDLNLVYNNLVISVGPNTPPSPMKRPKKRLN